MEDGDMHGFLSDSGLHASAERYKLEKIVGRGAYGLVWAVEDMVTNEKVAIKKVSRVFDHLTDARRTLREIKLGQHLDHGNVVKIKDVLRPTSLEDFNDVYVVYELMDMDLSNLIRSPQLLSADHCLVFMEQLLRGLKYIHSANVLHRDIKPSNVLVNTSCQLKICDFNLARAGGDSPGMTEYVVTRHYRAPELLLTCDCYTPAVDVWSAGCIFAELLTREVLFGGKDYMHQLLLIVQVLGTPTESELEFVASARARHFMEALPPHPGVPFQALFPMASPAAIDLLERMLVFDPARRISVDEALAHPYFEGGPGPEEDLELAHVPPEERDICPRPFDFDCESDSLTNDEIRRLLYEESMECEYRRSVAAEVAFAEGPEHYLD